MIVEICLTKKIAPLAILSSGLSATRRISVSTRTGCVTGTPTAGTPVTKLAARASRHNSYVSVTKDVYLLGGNVMDNKIAMITAMKQTALQQQPHRLLDDERQWLHLENL